MTAHTLIKVVTALKKNKNKKSHFIVIFIILIQQLSSFHTLSDVFVSR